MAASLPIKSFADGRYVVTRKLGEGGKGIVFQAQDTALQRVVAIKLLKKNVIDEESLRRFLEEARTVAQMTHSNISAVFDVGRHEDQHFVVLEYISGGDLAHRLNKSPNRRLPPKEILRIAAETCRALDHAHRVGMLHRDIKPENIMLTEAGEVKLSDFGLASRTSTPSSEAGIIVGTVGYLPPEAATGRGSEPRSDLYSLGVVMYEMAVGKPPFLGDDIQVIYSHIHDSPPPPRSINTEIPVPLELLILRLLAKDPDQRPASAAALLEEIESVNKSLSRQSPPSEIEGLVETDTDQNLVDRDEEIGILHRAVTDLKSGHGRVLLFNGEAGIGKSRLALELSKFASHHGILFLTGHAMEQEGAPPLAPWMEALREFINITPPQQLYKHVGLRAAVLVRVAPDLPSRLGPAMPMPAVPPELERFQLFDATTQLLINASRDSPLVVFLDDLHWADEASVQLFEYVARNAASESILLLGSYRPEDLVKGGPLEKCLYELNRIRRLDQIRLGRLAQEDVRTLIARTLLVDRVDSTLFSLVNERTGGNPFFVEELTLSLREEGHIVTNAGSAAWRGGPVRLPESVQHLIQRRFSRLSRPTQDLLLKASVLGRTLRPEVLAQMAGIERDAMIECVEEALRSGLLAEGSSGTVPELRFSEPQVRDCLYESISQMRRQRYHEQAAEVLGKRSSPAPEELAYHYAAAALPEPARKYLEAAGDEAMALSSLDRAAERYERALAFWPREERVVRRGLLIKLGDAYSGAGKWTWAREAYLEARRLVDAPRDDVSIAIRLGPALWYLGDVHEEHLELEKALKALGAERTSETAEALNWLSTVLLGEGDPVGSVRSAEQALEIAKEQGDRAEISFAINNLSWANALASNWELCGVYLSQELEVSEKSGVLYDIGNAADDAAIFYTLFLPDYERALEHGRRAIEIAERIGNHPAQVRWRLHRGWTLREMGRWDEADEEAKKAEALAGESYPHFVPWVQLLRGQLLALRGDLPVAERTIRHAIDTADKEIWWRLHFCAQANIALAWVRVEAGDREGARAAIRDACVARDQHRCGWCADLGTTVEAAVEAMDASGDAARFNAIVDEVHQRGTSASKASMVAIEARWKRLHSTPTDAQLDAAETYLRRISRRFDLASALHEHALTLNALGRTLEGNVHLEEALQILLSLGAGKRVRDVLQSKKFLKA